MATLKKPGFWEVTIERLKSKTPEYWRTIRNYAALIAAIGTLILGSSFVAEMPGWLVELAEILVSAGTAVAGFSSLTTKDIILQQDSEKAVKE